VQPDGKILAGGRDGVIEFPPDGIPNFALARYNSDGSLDQSFGAGGKVSTDFFGGSDGADAIALQPDGRIILAGLAANGPTAGYGLARYLADGSLDPDFGAGGKVITVFDGFSEATAIALQRGRKIVVVGSTEPHFSLPLMSGFAVATYNEDGSLDSSFGSGGIALTNFPGSDNTPLAVALQRDGRIIAAGRAVSQGKERFTLARYIGDPGFDLCLQDVSVSSLFLLDSVTGQYEFKTCGGLMVAGTGAIARKGGVLSLQDQAPDRSILATFDLHANTGSAAIQLLSKHKVFKITDKDTQASTCVCH